jgi:hypothetical protein
MSRKTKTEITAQLRMQVPEGANVAMVLEYIRSAVSSYAGGLDPENPMFDINKEEFTMKLVKKETTYV